MPIKFYQNEYLNKSLGKLGKLARPLWGKRPPLDEQAPAQGIGSVLGRLSLYAAPVDPPPGADAAYRRMTYDPQVRACLATKKYAVLSRGWEVHPGGGDPASLAAADFCRWCLDNMAGSILDAGYDVLDALAFGLSLVEINYRLIDDGPWAGHVGIGSLKAKDPRHFIIRTDEFYNIQALRVAAGDELDPDKFLIYSYMPRYGNPYGESDLRAAYRSWYLKDALLTWWAKYLEKFGMPTVVGSFGAGGGYTKQQQADFLSVVSQVHNESALVIPDDLAISLLEARTNSGGSSGFDEAVSYLDRAIAKAILGQSLTSDSSARGSTYALGAVQENVLRFYINKLTRDLEDAVLTRQLLARLVAYNFPPGTPTPAFKFGRLDDDRLAAAGTLIAEMVKGNVIAPDEPWIREYMGLPEREETDIEST